MGMAGFLSGMIAPSRDMLVRAAAPPGAVGRVFGIVTTGTSSLSIQLTYDRQVLDDAIKRITGGGLKPEDIVQGMQSSHGPTELR